MESDSTKTYQTDGNSQQQRGPGGAVTLKVTLGTVLCVCLAWTLCLGVLTVAPNAAVNRIMDTESFDDGAFWLIVDTPSPLRWIAVFGLSSVGLGYAFVLFILIFKRPRVMQGPAAPQRTVNFVKARAEKIVADAATDRKACQIATSAAKLAVNLSQGGTPARKRLVRR
ncbi:hypothetical protein BBJ28_00012457 [Nothophytophthora sp. Chile5]|nr:hypothetical protein BBJ28_00012457 [Nothophytophthora sp. Chile5]